MLNDTLIEKLNHVSDPGVSFYHYKNGGGDYFIKFYQNKFKSYQAEKKNHDLILNINQNIPTRYLAKTRKNISFIVYDFINFPSLDSLIQEGKNNTYKLIISCVDDIVSFLDFPEDKACTKPLFIIDSPYLTRDELKLINEFVKKMTKKINLFSLRSFENLVYTDRNPRNILVKNNKIIHIDFEIIKKMSPLFDLVKLIRNGRNFANISTTKINSCRLFKDQQELSILNYFCNKSRIQKKERKKIKLYFDASCAVIHLFYFFTYFERYKKTHIYNLKSRYQYHYLELLQLLDAFENYEKYTKFALNKDMTQTAFNDIVKIIKIGFLKKTIIKLNHYK